LYKFYLSCLFYRLFYVKRHSLHLIISFEKLKQVTAMFLPRGKEQNPGVLESTGIQDSALSSLYAQQDIPNTIGWLQHSWDDNIWKYSKDIQQASDRNVIDQLFELLNKATCNTKLGRFSDVLKLLVQLSQTGIIYLLEIHHQLSLVYGKVLYKYDNGQWHNPQTLFDLLLNNSCIKTIVSSLLQKEVFTESYIDKYFEREFHNFDKRSTMFLRRNHFLSSVRSVSNILN